MAVLNTLFFVYVEDGRQQRVVLTKNESMVEILQNIPSSFLNLIAGEYHVNASIYGIFYFNGQGAGMAVQILRFTFETIKTMCIL